MKTYITKRGYELSEEALKAIFENFVHEGDYEDWKNERIEQGIIKIAE